MRNLTGFKLENSVFNDPVAMEATVTPMKYRY